MDRRRSNMILGLGALLATAGLLLGHQATVGAGADPAPVEKLHGELGGVVAQAGGGGTLIPVTIVMRAQVDRGVIEAASLLPDRASRRATIRDNLEAVAAGTQGPVLALLRAGQARGEVGPRIRTLWLSNVIGADLTAGMVRRIAARDDVAYLNYNPDRDVFVAAPATAGPPTGIECGVALMRAPDVWNDYGITGNGVVVAMIDTGACYFHPDLVNQVWVNPGEDLDGDGVVWDTGDMNGVDDDGNGFVDDIIGWNFESGNKDPNDTFGHGTHTAGTVGGDGTQGTQTGMAPNCKLMLLKVGVTFADEMDVWNAMQYAADNSADVISMSLGWPHNVFPDRATWRTNCDNVIAMGTTMVIAAGNEGTCCPPTDNVRTPGDVPAVITVGATDCSDVLAGFSSQGPVTWQDVPPYNDFPYPPGLIKPTISGPGVGTISCDMFGCSGYVSMSGTSMATPHVAGAVALVLEANPTMTPADVKSILEVSAVDLGGPGDDNQFGWGRVDAYQAVTLSANPVPPVVSSITPSEGFVRQMTPVTITGDNFFGSMQVRFGSVAAPSVEVVDTHTLNTSAPPNVVLGPVDVSVDNFFGSGLLPGGFTYVPNIFLLPDSAAPGETVQISVTGPPLVDWGVISDTALGSKVVKGFTTCLAGSPDFAIVDHSRRGLPILNGLGQGNVFWTVPAGATPGQKFYFQALMDSDGAQPGFQVAGTPCAELTVQ